jgi:nucleotide-binding universal stress UspA family protein
VETFVGDPAPSVIEAANGGEGPALISVGSRGLGAFGRAVSGSVSDGVMRASRGPLLVALRVRTRAQTVPEDPAGTEAGGGDRGEGTARPTVLVATDGSDTSLHAGERAVGLATFLGAKLYVAYVVDEDRAFRLGIHYGEAVGELRAFGRWATGEIAKLAEGAGVEHEELVVGATPRGSSSRPPRTSAPDYVLMGSRGAARTEHALFGSVPEEVLRRADRTVLVVGGKRSTADPMLDALERSVPGPGRGTGGIP